MQRLFPALLAATLLPLTAQAALSQSEVKALLDKGVPGPTTISLRDQASLKLPDGYIFLPAEPAAKLMEDMGNKTDSRFLGLIIQHHANWLVDLEYQDSGYVKDDDANHWDADGLLKSLKEGTEAANEDRRAHQAPELEVTGWAETPAYNAGAHQLVWSALARVKNAPADQVQTVNYNTYALGREGYISLNLITDATHIADEKYVAKTLLSDISFNSGKRYEDFNSSTDHVAAYGLAALVAGVAAKKLGLLAIAGVFIAKFFKVIAIAAVAGAAALKKRMGGKS
jgi:uncharacterized membrane-anchored protein